MRSAHGLSGWPNCKCGAACGVAYSALVATPALALGTTLGLIHVCMLYINVRPVASSNVLRQPCSIAMHQGLLHYSDAEGFASLMFILYVFL